MTTFEEAVRRRGYHPGSPESCVLRDDCHKLGLKGEEALAALLGIAFDYGLACAKPEGDQGIDFKAIVRRRDGSESEMAIAVRCADIIATPANLVYDCKKARADLFVLCDYVPRLETATPKLWTTREKLVAAETRMMPGERGETHKCFLLKRAAMWPIDALVRRIVRAWQH